MREIFFGYVAFLTQVTEAQFGYTSESNARAQYGGPFGGDKILTTVREIS